MNRWLITSMVVGSTMTAQPAFAQDARICTSGSVERRVEIRYAGQPGQAPCEVTYTKQGQEQTLWTAQRDVAFCERKADGLVDTLENAGWNCSVRRTADAPAPTETPAAPPEPPEPPSDITTAEPVDRRPDAAPDPPLVPATPTEPPERAERGQPEAETARTAPDQARPPVVAARDEEAEPAEDDQPDADTADVARAGGVFAAAEALGAAVERDLKRLKKTADDNVEATVGSFGDLNGDQIDDAAVLITFDAEGNDHAQYLVAYVAQGDTFQPAASRFIGGRYRKIFGADVRAIRNGQIELDLQILAPDDPYCCPSETRSASFRLENGELIGDL
jgi:hypothetical protein